MYEDFGDLETKVRHVRTPAGQKRFGQPIGSIIVRDSVGGDKALKSIKVATENTYEGATHILGGDKKHYHIMKHDGQWHVVDAGKNNRGWEPVSAHATEDAAYAALDRRVKKAVGVPVDKPKPASRKPANTTANFEPSDLGPRQREQYDLLNPTQQAEYVRQRRDGASHPETISAMRHHGIGRGSGSTSLDAPRSLADIKTTSRGLKAYDAIDKRRQNNEDYRTILPDAKKTRDQLDKEMNDALTTPARQHLKERRDILDRHIKDWEEWSANTGGLPMGSTTRAKNEFSSYSDKELEGEIAYQKRKYVDDTHQLPSTSAAARRRIKQIEAELNARSNGGGHHFDSTAPQKSSAEQLADLKRDVSKVSPETVKPLADVHLTDLNNHLQKRANDRRLSPESVTKTNEAIGHAQAELRNRYDTRNQVDKDAQEIRRKHNIHIGPGGNTDYSAPSDSELDKLIKANENMIRPHGFPEDEMTRMYMNDDLNTLKAEKVKREAQAKLPKKTNSNRLSGESQRGSAQRISNRAEQLGLTNTDYMAAYDRGWRHSSTAKNPDLDRNPYRDADKMSDAWEDGYMDHATNRAKYQLREIEAPKPSGPKLTERQQEDLRNMSPQVRADYMAKRESGMNHRDAMDDAFRDMAMRGHQQTMQMREAARKRVTTLAPRKTSERRQVATEIESLLAQAGIPVKQNIADVLTRPDLSDALSEAIREKARATKDMNKKRLLGRARNRLERYINKVHVNTED